MRKKFRNGAPSIEQMRDTGYTVCMSHDSRYGGSMKTTVFLHNPYMGLTVNRYYISPVGETWCRRKSMAIALGQAWKAMKLLEEAALAKAMAKASVERHVTHHRPGIEKAQARAAGAPIAKWQWLRGRVKTITLSPGTPYLEVLGVTLQPDGTIAVHTKAYGGNLHYPLDWVFENTHPVTGEFISYGGPIE